MLCSVATFAGECFSFDFEVIPVGCKHRSSIEPVYKMSALWEGEVLIDSLSSNRLQEFKL